MRVCILRRVHENLSEGKTGDGIGLLDEGDIVFRHF